MGGIITGVVVGVIVALAGAVTNYLLTMWRDERLWQREDRYRDYTERRRLYADFLAATYPVVAGDRGNSEPFERLANHLMAIRLVAPELLIQPAEELYGYVIRLANTSVDWRDEFEYRRLAENFVQVSRVDLEKVSEARIAGG